MKCRICHTKEANQTGAHIFPAWMISSAFDEESRTRDHEIIWTIRTVNTPRPFFGRQVKPDKIVETIGRELWEDEIKNQINPVTMDHIWCRDCEKRFSMIEEYFLINVDRKTENFNFGETCHILTLESVNVFLVRLFIYSVVVRADLVNFAGFKLYSKTQKRLVKFLNRYLAPDLSETIKRIDQSYNKGQLLRYPFRLIKTEHIKGDTSNLIYIHDRYEKPYCFLINRYILQFYGKGNHAIHKPTSFYGISGIISKSSNIRNYKETSFRLCLWNRDVWRKVLDRIVEVQATIEFKQIVKMVVNGYRKTYGYKPSRDQVNEMLKRIFDLN